MKSLCTITSDPEAIRKRYETLLALYKEEFLLGIKESRRDALFLSKELLHCAVNAYFDDINKYKAYAGSQFADRHKQAAYTMIWITRFKPIQIKEGAEISKSFLIINQSFAIFAGLVFLNPRVKNCITKKFYDHLIYTLTYRSIEGRGLASMLYLMEIIAENKIQF